MGLILSRGMTLKVAAATHQNLTTILRLKLAGHAISHATHVQG